MRHRVLRGRDWRRGALAALVAACFAMPAGNAARSIAAEDDAAPPIEEAPPPPGATEEGDVVESPAEEAPPAGEGAPGRMVSEVIDSTYFIAPAEFFAIDLPVTARGGARAVHLLGDVTVHGKRDLIVRLFRASDYQDWLKRRGGRSGKPFWSSPRQRAIRLDQDLPAGTGVVLLLDNGYSLRTPKRVRLQIQMQYDGGNGGFEAATHPAASEPREGDITPRANTDDEFSAPPPPPSEGSN